MNEDFKPRVQEEGLDMELDDFGTVSKDTHGNFIGHTWDAGAYYRLP